MLSGGTGDCQGTGGGDRLDGLDGGNGVDGGDGIDGYSGLDGLDGGDGVDGRINEVEAADLVEEGGVAGVALELGVTGPDLGEEVAGGDILARLDDALDDVAQGVVVDA